MCNENEYEEDVSNNVEEAGLRVLITPTAPASVGFFERARVTSLNLWIVCMSEAFMLHIFAWFILIDQLSNVLRESDWHDGPWSWKEPLQIVVYGQGVLVMV